MLQVVIPQPEGQDFGRLLSSLRCPSSPKQWKMACFQNKNVILLRFSTPISALRGIASHRRGPELRQVETQPCPKNSSTL